MRLLFQLMSLFVVALFSLPSSAQMAEKIRSETIRSETIQWHEWSSEPFVLAVKQKKLVLLDISAQWCQFCKKMKAVTYQDPEVVKIINENYIAIHADIETTADVKMLYGDFGVPGTVVLTASRDEINKRLGYIAPQQMQWHLLGSLQDAPTDSSEKDSSASYSLPYSFSNNLSQTQ